MSYLVLARKYRPQTFDQVIKQEHVTQTLSNAVLQGRVAHGILFSGPRGTGKTTIARILAKSMNCSNNKKEPSPNPCNECRSCKEITSGNAADVFEIDGASNNSVDQIRNLRENIKYMPAHSPYKIYIIDEVHMLSIAAFNALLKTLEEPPAHVLFMFATTDPNKIPITILSRCQRHDLRRISLEAISEHMEYLCKNEGVDISNESLELIAREADGSMRDALSLLDQVISCCEGKVDHDHIINVLGVIDRKMIFDISGAVLSGKIPEILDMVDEIYARGHDLKIFYSTLIEHFRNLLIVKMGKMINKLVDVPAHELSIMKEQVQPVSNIFLNQILDILFNQEAAVKLSAKPKIALEMVFIRMFEIKPALPIDTLIEKFDTLGKELFSSLPEKSEQKPEQKPYKKPDQTPDRKPNMPPNVPDTYQKVRKEADSTIKSAQISQPSSATQCLPDNLEPDNLEPDKLEPNNIDIDNLGNDPVKIKKRLLDIITEKHPSLKHPLENSSLKKISNEDIELEINGGGFHLNMIKRKKDALEKICCKLFGKKINIIISAKKGTDNNNNKANTNGPLKQGAFDHPLVAEAIEIFKGKVVDIKTS
jgi:DNA polymerase-3 subunit gamma/tau